MGVERELVTLQARDGELHDALLHVDRRAARVRERATGRKTAIIHVHGIMGNFLVGTLRFFPGPLARAGYPTLVLETRMGNVGQLFGQAIFDDATMDIDAGWRWLRDRGFDHLVVTGYSSGATLATRFAATHPQSPIAGLVCLGNPWGLPQSLAARSQRWGAEPSYAQIVQRLQEAIGDDPDRPELDRLFVIERSRGPTRQPRDSEVYTYRTWWHSRGPEATAAMAYRQIGAVTAPILLVQGTADHVVHPEEAEALYAAARKGGNRDVELRWVEGADHFFSDREIVALDVVTTWLRSRA
ncbi:MAG: alpha/beta hydrolase [Thermoleophilia bacterium]|jgi:pimeloyl-ACP methyl ester carboxylesterase|nr:alpha/beta hydrolase [Thermoleophilia bacterium]